MLEINLFGKFGVFCDQRELKEFNALKVQQLFCYLLLFRQRAHRREYLSDLLWGENATPLARKYLRKALWQLQAAMNAFPEPLRRSLLVVDSDWIQVNQQAEFVLDIQTFDQGFNTLQAIHPATFSSTDFTRLQSTLDIYRGELLEGWSADWCLYEREHFKSKYLALVDKGMEHCETTGDYSTGIEVGSRALLYDTASEQTHWRLMRLFYLSDDRSAAIHQFKVCCQTLKSDLDVEPSEKTVALFNQIVNQPTGLPRREVLGPAVVPASLPALVEAMDRINALVEMQATIQHQLAEQLAAVEQTLKKLI